MSLACVHMLIARLIDITPHPQRSVLPQVIKHRVDSLKGAKVTLSCVPEMLADVMVVSITWMKMYHQVRDASKAKLGPNASRIMLEDGTQFTFMPHSTKLTSAGSLYFVCVDCLNSIQPIEWVPYCRALFACNVCGLVGNLGSGALGVSNVLIDRIHRDKHYSRYLVARCIYCRGLQTQQAVRFRQARLTMYRG